MVREGSSEALSRNDELAGGLDAPLVKQGQASKASAFATGANLTTAALGSGLLSLPWTGAGASVLNAVVLTGLALLLNAWTTMIIVRAAEKHQVFDLGSLLAHLPGRLGSSCQWGNNIAIFISQFISLVSYCIIVADSVLAVVGGSRVACIVVFSFIVLPLSFANLRYLAITSTLAIIVTLYIIGYTGYLSFAEPLVDVAGNELCMIAFTKAIVSMISALILSTVLQIYVLPMYEELADRSVHRFRIIIFSSFSIIFFLYTGFTVLALFAFGRDVKSNVLDSMPDRIPAHLARLSMVVVMLGVYPINIKPMMAMIHDRRLVILATPCIVAATMLVACFVKDLGVINVLNGALCLGAFVTICPALIGLHILKMSRHLMLALMIFGVVTTVFGSVFVDNYVDALIKHCMWW